MAWIFTLVLFGLGTLYGVLYVGFVAATEMRLRRALARGEVSVEPRQTLRRFTRNALAHNPDIDYRYGAFEVAPGHVIWLRGHMDAHARYMSIVVYDRLMQSVADGACPGPTTLNGDQLVFGDNGAFEVALAARDLGVPNWLDVSSTPQGVVVVRHIGGAPDDLEQLDIEPIPPHH